MSPVNNRFKQFIGFGTMVALIGVGLYTGLQNVSKAGSQVVGCTQGCGAESDHTGTGEFKVMSLNMLHGYPDFDHLEARLGLIADEIRRQDADVVCLQEAPWRPGIGYASENLADMTGMNHVYLRANGNKGAIRFEEGVAILSRYPILGTGFTELSPRAGFFENRVALHALVDAPQGPLDVFVTHLTHGDEQINAGQADDLRRFIEAKRTGFAIVAGDFNAQEGSPQIEALSEFWVDAYEEADPEGRGSTCCISDLNAEVAESLDARIDYIFLAPYGNQRFELAGVQRVFDHPFPNNGGWLWASDHAGLLAKFMIKRE